VDERYDADTPFIDDPTLKTFNAEDKMVELVNYL
jgi:hypothetical protein